MAQYKYRAQDATGKTRSGTMAAQNKNDLHEKLKEQGLFLIAAAEEQTVKTVKPLKAKQLSQYAREIGTLLGSGVSLVRALRIMMEEETISVREKAIYENILTSVRQGVPLSEAMDEQRGAFPPLMINMFKAAEVSGSMDKTAMRMAVHYEKEDRLNSKVKSSMIYPKILSVLIVIVVSIIMGYVVPQFKPMFDQMETMPTATVILFAISGFIQTKWLFLIIFITIAVLAFRLIMLIPSVHLFKDRLLLKLPVFGKLETVIFTARFARTLSSLYTAGIPIVTSLQIAKNTIGNYYIESQFDDIIADVRAGLPLSEALSEVDGFVKKLSSSIRIGEETGSLDSMLISTADNLDYEAEMAITRMVAFLEPAMIVIMAVIVGFIMIAVIVPIYGSYETIGKSST